GRQGAQEGRLKSPPVAAHRAPPAAHRAARSTHRAVPATTGVPMPLPKPPAKRADFLSRSDFESPSPHRAGKHGGRAQPAAEPAASSLLELSNEGTLPAAPPVAAQPVAAAPVTAAKIPA